MDTVQIALTRAGFTTTGEPLPTTGWIAHGIAGCGKTTTLRALLNEHWFIRVHTYGPTDPPNQSGRFITKPNAEDLKEPNLICVLDEYAQGPFIPGYHLYLTDPCQADPQNVRRAHFRNNLSWRVPRVICEYLRKLNYDILPHSTNQEGYLSVAGKFEPASGTVIVETGLIHEELAKSKYSHYTVAHAVGREWPNVTVYFQRIEPDSHWEVRKQFFIAATRSAGKLHVRHYVPIQSPGQPQVGLFDASCRSCLGNHHLVAEEEHPAARRR